MIVYSFVFSVIMRLGVEDYAVFLISALLGYNFLANSVSYGTSSIVANSNLVNKIYFPREILPLSIVFANLVNFLLELIALFIVLAFLGYKFYIYLYLLPLVIFIQFFLVAGFTLLVSSLNVFFRDLQHLISIIMMVWFFATPIIYPLDLVQGTYRKILMLNPMTLFVMLYRNIFYYVNHREGFEMPNLYTIVSGIGMSIIIFLVGYFVFKKLEPRFVEEI